MSNTNPPLDFFAAIEDGNAQSLARLIASGSDIEAKNQYGWTPAMAAAHYGHADCLAQLIAKGCDLEARDKDGRPAATLAAQKHHAPCLALIESELARRELLRDTPAARHPPRRGLRM